MRMHSFIISRYARALPPFRTSQSIDVSHAIAHWQRTKSINHKNTQCFVFNSFNLHLFYFLISFKNLQKKSINNNNKLRVLRLINGESNEIVHEYVYYIVFRISRRSSGGPSQRIILF